GEQPRASKVQTGFGQEAALELYLPALEQTAAGNTLPGDYNHDHNEGGQGHERHDQCDATARRLFWSTVISHRRAPPRAAATSRSVCVAGFLSRCGRVSTQLSISRRSPGRLRRKVTSRRPGA